MKKLLSILSLGLLFGCTSSMHEFPCIIKSEYNNYVFELNENINTEIAINLCVNF